MQRTLMRADEVCSERVTTGLELSSPPEAVWRSLMFYEDVPHRPWPVLRWLLPQPLRSEGEKQRVGSAIRCSYDRGYLVKSITRVEAARFLGFEVLEQRLGIERYGMALRGSYELEPTEAGTRIVLTTEYEGKLSPRFFWRFFERYLCHRLHDHILRGMKEQLLRKPDAAPALSAGAGRRSGTAAAPSR